MGTWALPNTKKKAEELQKLFKNPIYSNESTKDTIYDLYGDDDLFDAISDREYEEGSDYDIRFVIACHLNSMIEYYEKSPKCFNVKFDKGAIKILKKIVKEQGV